MRLLQNIRNKIASTVQNTIRGVGNAIDRDQSLPGVQIAPGGISAGLQRASNTNFVNPITYNQSRIDQRREAGDPIPLIDEILYTANNSPLGKFVENRVVQPAIDIPKNVGIAFDPSRSAMERALGGVSAVGGLLPGIDDIVFGGIDAVKAGLAGNDPIKGFTGEEYTPLGDIARNRGAQDDSFLSSALDIAEIPLTTGSVIATGKGADNLVRRSKGISKRVDDLPTPKAPRAPKPPAVDSLPLNRAGVEEILDPILRDTPQSRGLEAIADLDLGERAVTGLRNLRKQFPQPKQLQESLDNILQVPTEQPRILSQAEQAAQGAVDSVRQAGNSRRIRAQAAELQKQFGKLPKQTAESIPGAPPKIPGEIDEAINTLRNMKNRTVKKLNSYELKVLEPRRVLRKFFPEDKELLEQVVWRPLNKLRGEAADFKRGYEQRVRQLGKEFKAGSKYSELTHKFGEGKISRDQLVKQVGEAGAVNIENAARVFRQMYDEILDTINARRSEVGLPEIAKRDDYFRHMNEVSGFDMLESLLTGKPAGASPASSSIAKRRKGDKTIYDAVGGFQNYLQLAGRAGFTDTIAPRLKDIARQASKGGNYQASEYLEWLADSVLGARSVSGFEKGAGAIAGKIMGSRVVGNLSSVWNQLASLPMGAVDAGITNVARGLVSKDASNAWKNSSYAKSVSYKPDPQLESGMKRALGIGANVLKDMDTTVKKTVWQGMYENAKRLGEANPTEWADEMTEMVMGIRDVGGSSQFQSSTWGRFIAPFTSEAQGQANRLLEMVGEKKFGKIAGVLVANFLFNEVSERFVTGQRVVFDPIDATIDATQTFLGLNDKEKNEVKALGRLVAESLKAAPVVGGAVAATGQVVDFLDSEDKLPNTEDFFGSEDPTRFGSASMFLAPAAALLNPPNITGNPIADRVAGVAGRVLPYGNQALKTAQAASALNRGNVESRGGRVMFDAPDTLLGAARALMFGPYVGSKAREYFDNDNRPLSDRETDLYYALPKERRDDFLRTRQEAARKRNQGLVGSSAPSESFLDRILGREQGFSFGEYPTDKESQKVYKENVILALDSGETPPVDAIRQAIFNGKTVKDNKFADRRDTYIALKKAMANEWYTDEQKKAILDASGANEAQYEYFRFADMTVTEKLEELMPTLGDLSDPQNFLDLAFMRAKLGGEQGLTSDMITYLYENEMIDDGQRDLLNALQYDELKQKFYFKRDSKFGSSGSKKKGRKLTYNQALKLYSPIGISEMNKLRTDHTALNAMRRYGEDSGLIERILAR